MDRYVDGIMVRQWDGDLQHKGSKIEFHDGFYKMVYNQIYQRICNENTTTMYIHKKK